MPACPSFPPFFQCPSDSPPLHPRTSYPRTPSQSNQAGLLLIIIRVTGRYSFGASSHNFTLHLHKNSEGHSCAVCFSASISAVIMKMYLGASPRAWELFGRAGLEEPTGNIRRSAAICNLDVAQRPEQLGYVRKVEVHTHSHVCEPCLPLHQGQAHLPGT